MSVVERMNDFSVGGVHKTTDAERHEAAMRPTGQDLFDAKTEAEQNEMLGPDAAEKVRTGEAALRDFVKHEAPGDAPGFITQKPVEDLQ